MSAQSPWQVDVAVPDGLGDLGLHRDEDEAAARFRRQLAEALGAERAAEVGPAAEREFRRARAEYVGKPVLWSGFLLLASHAASGLDVRLDPAALPDDPAEADRVRALAEVEDALLLTLSVGVSPVSLPPSGPLTAAGLISRTLRAQFGENAHVHLVSYGTRQAVASVRVVEPPAARRPGDDAPEPTTPPATVLAEVRVPFVEDGAMVTVTAATAQPGAVDRAVLLAGSIARTVRVRPTGRPAPRLAVVLPDGTRVPEGATLVGRRPGRTEELPAEHTVTLPHPSVSRTHLALHVQEGAVTATDLGSTNGTAVRRGGRAVALEAGRATELEAGDVLAVGDVVLRVVADDA